MDVVEGVEVDGGGDRSAQLFGGLSGNHGGRGRDVVEVTISKKTNSCLMIAFYFLLCSLTIKTGHPICKSLYLNTFKFIFIIYTFLLH